MKIQLFTLILLSISLIGNSTVKDSVSYGGSYTNSYKNDVYYSLTNGIIDTVERATWDIAFSTSRMSSSILINDGSGVELYTYPNGDTSMWNSVDTSGIQSWNKMYNGEEDWEDGAFGKNQKGHPDYGWGVYNPVSHNVEGNTLFIIKLLDGSYKKIWILSKESSLGKYNYRLANIDGSNDTIVSIDCNTFQNKNFIYCSLTNNSIIDREPNSDRWDIVFTKYSGIQNDGSYYNVTGVLSNNKVKSYAAEEVDTSIFNWHDYNMTAEKSNIGWSWKSFNMNTYKYDIQDSLVFFVQGLDKNVYKMIFTGFDGAATGNVYFTKELLSLSSVKGQSKIASLNIYPNPTTNYVIVNIDKKIDNNSQIRIFDINGKEVFNKTVNKTNERIDLSGFNTGLYFIIYENNNSISSNQLIIK